MDQFVYLDDHRLIENKELVQKVERQESCKNALTRSKTQIFVTLKPKLEKARALNDFLTPRFAQNLQEVQKTRNELPLFM